MHKAIEQTAELDMPNLSNKKVNAFNYNKLQAVICMTLSAAVSISLIIWAVRSFF